MKVVFVHERKQTLVIQKPVVFSKQWIVDNERCMMLIRAPALLAKRIADKHGGRHQLRKIFCQRLGAYVCTEIRHVRAGKKENFRPLAPNTCEERPASDRYMRLDRACLGIFDKDPVGCLIDRTKSQTRKSPAYFFVS